MPITANRKWAAPDVQFEDRRWVEPFVEQEEGEQETAAGHHQGEER